MSARADEDGLRVLFVCSRNRWRSPTAERIYRGRAGIAVRSAGTSPNAAHPVSADDVAWSTVIIVMEGKHRDRLRARFPDALRGRAVHVLGIPDEYRYMQPELVEELTALVDPLLFSHG